MKFKYWISFRQQRTERRVNKWSEPHNSLAYCLEATPWQGWGKGITKNRWSPWIEEAQLGICRGEGDENLLGRVLISTCMRGKYQQLGIRTTELKLTQGWNISYSHQPDRKPHLSRASCRAQKGFCLICYTKLALNSIWFHQTKLKWKLGKDQNWKTQPTRRKINQQKHSCRWHRWEN